MKQVLKIRDLSKSYGGIKLFEQASLTLAQGTINTLFGSNGSGKSTLFNMLAGFIKPDAGSISFNGALVKYHHAAAMASAGIGKMWQEPLVFPNHTVLENMLVSHKQHPGENLLNYLFKPRSIRKQETALRVQALHILSRFKLAEKAGQPAGILSLGERKLLSISMLHMNNAQLFLLDEPFSNINPQTIQHMSEALLELKAQHKTVFMIEHKITEAQRISDVCFRVNNLKIENITP